MGTVGEEDDLELQEKEEVADRGVEDSEGEARDNYGGEG